MIYKRSEVEKAVGIIFPQYSNCKENGVPVNLPQWLDMVATQYFLEHYPKSDRSDIVRMEAFKACHSALQDLSKLGWMEEGSCELHFYKFYKGE